MKHQNLWDASEQTVTLIRVFVLHISIWVSHRCTLSCFSVNRLSQARRKWPIENVDHSSSSFLGGELGYPTKSHVQLGFVWIAFMQVDILAMTLVKNDTGMVFRWKSWWILIKLLTSRCLCLYNGLYPSATNPVRVMPIWTQVYVLWGFPETVLGPIGSSMHCSVAQKWTAAEAGGLTVAQAVAARGQAGGRGSPPGPPCLLPAREPGPPCQACQGHHSGPASQGRSCFKDTS